MKKLLMTAVATIFLASSVLAQGQDGSGGGGPIKNGRYMTFHSAGLYTEPTSLKQNQIPGLSEVSDLFAKTDLLRAETKVSFLNALTPTFNRSYYNINAATFTPEVRARILAEYKRVMPGISEQVTLYAITETKSKTTYLFPEFYRLNPFEQQAILFHEAYWIVNPKASYKNVIDAEISFQAYLENPNSIVHIKDWIQTIGTDGDLVKAAINYDLTRDTLNNLFYFNKKQGQKGLISSRALFGEEWYRCSSNCSGYALANLYVLTRQYPESMLLQVLYELISGFKMRSDRFLFFFDEVSRDSLLNINSNGQNGKAAVITILRNRTEDTYISIE